MASQEDNTNQFLTFYIEGQTYAASVGEVREVLDFTEITPIPRMDESMRGVINVRGSVVPVIDLKEKFALGRTDLENGTPSIVIMELPADNGVTIVGALVDSVEAVIQVPPENIDSAPRTGATVDTAFISGLAKRESDFVVLLDTQKLFGEAEIATAAAQQA